MSPAGTERTSSVVCAMSAHDPARTRRQSWRPAALLFSEAAPLCGNVAFPASAGQTLREILFAGVRAFRRVFISLLAIRKADLLPFSAGLGRKCRGQSCGEINKSRKANSNNRVSHDRVSIDLSIRALALYQIVFGRGQLA
jgi:hypothetical protein